MLLLTALGALLGLAAQRWRRHTLGAFIVVLSGLLVWWSTVEPSNDREWKPDVAIRDEQGEGYSTVKGLFKQYEIFYVVADERDVIRLRTNYRRDPPEDVYLYRVQGPLENGRRLFLEYLRKIELRAEQPEFYHSVTSNCAGNIWLNAQVNPGRVSYSWKILLSGHVPEHLHGLGLLDTRLTFAELQRRSRVNDAAQAAEEAVDFSA